MGYSTVTFKDLSAKRRENVRTKIETMWREGYTTQAIAKTVKIGVKSVATAIGNLTRKTY